MDYLIHILILFGILSILAVSLDMIVGYTGIVSFAHAAFYAVGAYVGSLLYIHFQINILLSLLLSFIITALIGALIFAMLLRLKEDYLILSFFALHEVILGVFHNWNGLTNGPAGLYGILRPSLFGYVLTNNYSYLAFVLLVLAVVLLFLYRWIRTPWGYMARGVRDDALLISVMGYRVKLLQIVTFAVGVGFAGVAGVLYAHYINYISPAAFSIALGVTVFTYVFIGGPASMYGPIIGTALMVALPEVLRLVGMPDSFAGPLQQIIYGSLLILLIFFRPQGLFGKYKVGQGG